jgi:lipoyl(octanoyl) transferase
MLTNKYKMSDYIKKDWGLIDYETARQKQRKLFELGIQQRKTGENLGFKNHLIFCEHPHVFTLGMNAGRENLLVSDKELHEKSIQCIKTERGGNITYHGPGQLLCYPILNLKALDLYLIDYVYKLEEIIIQSIKSYGITGFRIKNAPGVWVDNAFDKPKKIAAIGVRSSRFITMHGFSLNANTNMDYFKMINPCGFDPDAVCSIQSLRNEPIDTVKLKAIVTEAFEKVFGMI